MKIFMSFLALTFLASTAQAGSTVCAGERLSYVQKRADMGMRPPIGMQIGFKRIIWDAEVLLDDKIYYGGTIVNLPAYKVVVDEESKEIVSAPNDEHSYDTEVIFKGVAIVMKLRPDPNTVAGRYVEINRDHVTCRSVMGMLRP